MSYATFDMMGPVSLCDKPAGCGAPYMGPPQRNTYVGSHTLTDRPSISRHALYLVNVFMVRIDIANYTLTRHKGGNCQQPGREAPHFANYLTRWVLESAESPQGTRPRTVSYK